MSALTPPDEAIALLDSWVEEPACDGEITGELIAAAIVFDTAASNSTRNRLTLAVAAYKRETRTLVRGNRGGMGCNWDLDDAIEHIRRATEIRRLEWDDMASLIYGHGVVAIVEGRAISFGSQTRLDELAGRGLAQGIEEERALAQWMASELGLGEHHGRWRALRDGIESARRRA